MFDTDEYLQVGLARNLNGRSLDKWMTVMSPQKNDRACFLRFDLKSPESLQSMIAEPNFTTGHARIDFRSQQQSSALQSRASRQP
jgi:hypothetical protein